MHLRHLDDLLKPASCRGRLHSFHCEHRLPRLCLVEPGLPPPSSFWQSRTAKNCHWFIRAAYLTQRRRHFPTLRGVWTRAWVRTADLSRLIKDKNAPTEPILCPCSPHVRNKYNKIVLTFRFLGFECASALQITWIPRTFCYIAHQPVLRMPDGMTISSKFETYVPNRWY